MQLKDPSSDSMMGTSSQLFTLPLLSGPMEPAQAPGGAEKVLLGRLRTDLSTASGKAPHGPDQEHCGSQRCNKSGGRNEEQSSD